MKTQSVVVDIGNLKASDIFFVQGEKGREITFKVINSLLEDFVNLAGYTATIHILKSDGNFTIATMTIDSAKSECYYTLTENDCACGGRGFYDLSFSKNDELIYTAHGDFVGDFRSVNDDSVASVSSAYGVTFPEGFQEKLIAGDKIHINENNVISAEGEVYTAGDNINISSQNVISATDTKYTAGDNINISSQNVISATDTKYTAGDNIEITNQNVINALSSIKIENLYTSSATGWTTFNLNEDKSIDDYDYILITTQRYISASDHPFNGSYLFNVKDLRTMNVIQFYGYDNEYASFSISNDGHTFTLLGGSGISRIYNIKGVTL